MATKTLKATANTGAAIERGKLLAKLRRMRITNENSVWSGAYNEALSELAKWVKGSAARASKKPGGLGRK